MSDIIYYGTLTLDQIEREVILSTLKRCRGNKTKTAQILNVAIRTIDNKVERYEQEDKIRAEATEMQRLKDEEYLKRARGIRPEIVNPVTVTKVIVPDQVTDLRAKKRG